MESRQAPTRRLLVLMSVVVLHLASPIFIAASSVNESAVVQSNIQVSGSENVAQKSGNGNKGSNKKEKPEKEEKGKDKAKDEQKKQPISLSQSYEVDVQCIVDDDLDQSTCTFNGLVPESGKKVNHLTLPKSAVCATVVDGDYVYSDPNSSTNLGGYGANGSTAQFTLVLEGEVTTFGSTTYWLKVGSSVFPATGPGLSCVSASVTEPVVDVTEEATAAATTGTLVVTRYTCIDVPEAREDYDWFGTCHVMDGSMPMTLTSVSTNADYSDIVTTTGVGELSYDGLDQGEYRIEAVDTIWCHGEADNVTSEGNLILTAAGTTHTWLFFCS